MFIKNVKRQIQSIQILAFLFTIRRLNFLNLFTKKLSCQQSIKQQNKLKKSLKLNHLTPIDKRAILKTNQNHFLILQQTLIPTRV